MNRLQITGHKQSNNDSLYYKFMQNNIIVEKHVTDSCQLVNTNYELKLRGQFFSPISNAPDRVKALVNPLEQKELK